MRPWAQATPGRSPQGALPFSGAPCQGPCPLRNFPFEARGPEPVWNTGPGSSQENEGSGPTAKTGVDWVLFIFVNKEICLNGNQQWGCSFPPLRVSAAAARLPTPGRTPVSSVGRAVRRGHLGKRAPGRLHPSLPAGGSQSRPLGCPSPALIPGTDADSCSRLVRQGATANGPAPGRGGACTPGLSYSASLSLRLLICTMRASRAFLRIRWERTTGWPGGRGAWPVPAAVTHTLVWIGESPTAALGAHLLLNGPKCKPRTLRALDPGVILRLLKAPAPPSQGPGRPGHLAVTSADPRGSNLHPDCFPRGLSSCQV